MIERYPFVVDLYPLAKGTNAEKALQVFDLLEKTI